MHDFLEPRPWHWSAMELSDADNPYLKPGRLADVFALIQLLAFERKSGYLWEASILDIMDRPPSGGGTWIRVAQEHQEFFRVRDVADTPNRAQRAGLLVRYLVGKNEVERVRKPTDAELVTKLIEIAMDLHDRQVDRKQQFWKLRIPILAALTASIIAATASIYAATIKSDDVGKATAAAARK
jgi:hypothetical protein